MEAFAGHMTVKVPTWLGLKSFDNVWCVLFTSTPSKHAKMELYANENTKSGKKRVIYFEQAKWKKVTDIGEFAFSVELKGNKDHTFIVSSKEEMKKWILSLCIVCKDLYDDKQKMGVEDNGKVDLDSCRNTTQNFEINSLYSTTNKYDEKLHFFFVAVDKDSDFKKREMSGVFRMVLVEETILICGLDSDDVIIGWSLYEIRKYGFNSHFFYLLAGTKAEDREGNYTFFTVVGENIKNFVLTEANKLREIHKDEIARNRAAELEASTSTDQVNLEIDNHTAAYIKDKSAKKSKVDKATKNKNKKEKSQTKSASSKTLETNESHYAKPWGNKKSGGAKNFNIDNSNPAETYTVVTKTQKDKPPIKSREAVHKENYEDRPDTQPEIIPPLWERENETNNSSNTYAHFNSTSKKPENVYGFGSASSGNTYDHFSRNEQGFKNVDNVYGMESASSPMAPVPSGQENPYEDTNPSANAYESVPYS